MNFDDLNISDEIKDAINDMGFERLTPIQKLSIPEALKGTDVTGQAQTGSGKTIVRQEYIIRFKNENIISYRDGEADVVVPDLICMLDRDGNPVTTPNFIDGMEMNIFALPAPEIWKIPDGIKCFVPEHFGLPVHFRNS